MIPALDTLRLPPELADLLGRLQARGIEVGPLEIARLHHLLGVDGTLCPSTLEIARQRHLLGVDRTLCPGGLEGLLRSILCKDAEQRTRFRRAYRDWVADFDQARESDAGRPAGEPEEDGRGLATPEVSGRVIDPTQATGAVGATRRRIRGLRLRLRRYRRQALGVAAFVAMGLVIWYLQQPPEPPKPIPVPAGTVAETPVSTGVGCPRDLPADPAPKVWAWAPVPDLRPWAAFGGGVLVLLVTAAAARRLLRAEHRYLKGPPPSPGGDAAPSHGLPPPAIRGDLLLDPAERREMVWSIDRYVSDEPSRDLDPEATVAATASAGGEPRLVERHRSFPREVWLWCDRSSADPGIQDRLVAEVRRALTQANLPVRVARFHGLPQRLVWDDSREPFTPGCTEGAGARAVVAVLTDAAAILHARDARGERPRLERTLGELRTWPRLCLVDLGGTGELRRLAAPWAITVRGGDGLAAWLAGRAATEAPAPDPAQLDLWAGAWLLGGNGSGTDHDTAQALRLAMDLRLQPMDYPALLARLGECSENRSLADRLLNRIARTQALDRDGLPEGDGPFTRAIGFWEHRIGEGIARLRTDDAETCTRLEWRLARLHLLTDPRAASEDLLRLAHGRTERLIRATLGRLAPDRAPQPVRAGAARVRPAWDWSRLPRETMFRLLRLGLAGHAPGAWRPRLGARHHLALALLAGTAVTGIGLGGRQLWDPEIGGDPRFQGRRFSDRIIQVHRDGAWLGSPWSLTRLPALGPLHTPYTWTWQPVANPQPLGAGAGILVGGTQAFPIGRCGPVEPGRTWPGRSLAAIAAPIDDPDARRLAIRLLDRGTADRVLLASDWRDHLGKLDQGLRLDGTDPDDPIEDQLVVFLPPDAPAPAEGYAEGFARVAEVRGDWTALAKTLDFREPRLVAAAWPDAGTRALAGEPLIRGGTETWTDPKTGAAWVLVCGGTFLMGSGEEEDAHLDEYAKDWVDAFGGTVDDRRENLRSWLQSERPRHPVLVDDYWIAATELTRGQYRTSGNAVDGDATLPMAEIDWNASRKACESLPPPPRLPGEQTAGRPGLPTEAQWEYAARAGTSTRWSFGDDRDALGDHAWFRDNADKAAHPVGRKVPNGLCLADLEGNVLEWVADCFDADAYRRSDALVAVERKVERDECATRVVRGGSFFVPPDGLRPAFRFAVWPDGRGIGLGLRCVRSRARQH